MIEKIWAVDLEMDQPGREIIQVGIAVGNAQSRNVTATRDWIIDPGHPLNPEIVKLTGITDQIVRERAVPGGLPQAYKEMVDFLKAEQVFRNPVVWGQGDCPLLMEQLGLHEEDFFGGRREIDVKTLFVAARAATGEKHQAGLAKAMTKLGLTFQGKKHWAPDDAKNTMLLYFEVLRKLRQVDWGWKS